MRSYVEWLPLPDLAEVQTLVENLREGSFEFNLLYNRYGEARPALRHYGLIQWRIGNMSDAASALRAALGLNEANADIWRDLAGVYIGSGDLPASEKAIRSAIQFDPGNARGWLHLANVFNQTSRTDDAIGAYQRAIHLAPGLGDAYLGLGLLQYGQLQMDHAIETLTLALTNGCDPGLGHQALGQVHYLAGQFEASANMFERALEFGDLDHPARMKYARARTFAVLIEGNIERALDVFSELAGNETETSNEMLRDAFSQLSAYGYREAALVVGRYRLAQDPNDHIQRYHLEAISGSDLTKAPDAYVEAYFDRFAGTFEHKLVEVLKYDAPAILAGLIEETRATFHSILDLGCGTGLAAAHLARLGEGIVGVDLSEGMLQQAASRRPYAALVKAEAVNFLEEKTHAFDLIFAADMLVYLGDLGALFTAAANALNIGGLFAFTIETADSHDFKVLSSGRFAHKPDYIERLARPAFVVRAKQEGVIRQEAGRSVKGLYAVLERKVS